MLDTYAFFHSEYPAVARRKFSMWLNMPSHYQLDFINALEQAGLDLKVNFFGKVDDARIFMGWNSKPDLSSSAQYISPDIKALIDILIEQHDRVHIVPGTVGNKFLMTLVDHMIRDGIDWVHWSECVLPGFNRLIRLPFRKIYGRKINTYALGALAISRMAEREFRTWGVSASKIRFLPYTSNPLSNDTPPANRFIDFVKNRFVFVFSGTLCHRKGTDLLLESFKSAVDRYPQAALLLLGPDTTERYYKRYSERLGIPEESILFAGPVAYSDLGSIVSLSDVFILPTRYDGWGMVLYEAATLGKAVISTDRCGAAHHLICADINGVRVKAGDKRSLFTAMERYLTSPGLSEIHGAHSKCMAFFLHPDKNAQRFLCAMESLITLKRKSNTP